MGKSVKQPKYLCKVPSEALASLQSPWLPPPSVVLYLLVSLGGPAGHYSLIVSQALQGISFPAPAPSKSSPRDPPHYWLINLIKKIE